MEFISLQTNEYTILWRCCSSVPWRSIILKAVGDSNGTILKHTFYVTQTWFEIYHLNLISKVKSIPTILGGQSGTAFILKEGIKLNKLSGNFQVTNFISIFVGSSNKKQKVLFLKLYNFLSCSTILFYFIFCLNKGSVSLFL